MQRWQSYIALVALFLTTTCSKAPGYRDEGWLDWVLSNLTFSHKIGQLVFVKQSANEAALSPEIQGLVSGFFVARNGYESFLSQIPTSQALVKIPYLILPDETWGFPSTASPKDSPLPIAFAAANSDSLVEQWAYTSAIDLRASGFNGGYLPIVDVASRARSKISTRLLLGDEPQLVDLYAATFVSKLKELQCMPMARPLPDSHDATDPFGGDSKIRHASNRERSHLDRAIAAGAECLVVDSSCPPDRLRHGSLLLRTGAYDGLILVDAGKVSPDDDCRVLVERLIEGADGIVTSSGNVQKVFNLIANAVMDGLLTENRLNDALSRVLRKKLAFATGAAAEGIPVSEPGTRDGLTARVSDASITLLRDRRNVLPLQAERLSRLLLVSVGTETRQTAALGTRFAGECRKRVPGILESVISANADREVFERIFFFSELVDGVVVAIFDDWRYLAIPDSIMQQLQAFLQTEIPLVVVSFGAPDFTREFSAAPSLLCAWSHSLVSIQAATRAVFGEIDVVGRLPLAFDRYYAGYGLDRTKHSMRLVRDIDNRPFENAFEVLREAIRQEIFPGAQVAIIDDGRLIASHSVGRFTYEDDSPVVTTKTIYDISSITKVAATTLCAMRLWEEGRLPLDAAVRNYLPGFSGPFKDFVTVKDLLTHTAGIERWLPLWERVKEPQEVFPFVMELPLKNAPGDTVVYSDFGFMLFGKILEELSGLTLQKMTEQWFLQPMDLRDTFFNPSQDLRSQIPPTELRGDMGRKPIQGEVHDANAFFVGGVAAHAGLFSTAENLAEIAQMLLNGGIYNHRRLLSPETINYWTQPQVLADSINHALGWDIPRTQDSSAGRLFSQKTYGHLGFTGTSMWIDPERRIAVILLTNRTFPSKHRNGIHEVRKDFHDRVMATLVARRWRSRTH
jgi:CubicO group peptidase (beta-lactamase class C family)/beta-glucosidase-like glycosyl hydrolase